MQRYIKVKMDYKHNEAKQQPYPLLAATSKWKLPLACSSLAFVLCWQLVNWLPSFVSPKNNQEWLPDNQITLNITLPKNDENHDNTASTLLFQSSDSESEQTFTVKSGDNLAHYFQQAKLGPKALQEILSLREAHYLKRIYPGQVLRIQSNEDAQLQTLQFDIDPLTTLVVKRHKNGHLISKIEEKPIEKRIAFGGSLISDSFFVAGKQANLDDSLIMALASVFAYDIDFAQDIQPNDHFKVLFEEYFVNGVKVGNGPIVAAEFVNNGKMHQAIRYTDSAGQSGYYSPSGQSLKKAFIRTPVQFTRISSHFNLQRHHPILHKIRAHKGVDYAAPEGTPVKAAGEGKIIFVGKKGGYGNAIILQHGTRYTTLYGHLSRFAKNLKTGKSIRQGEIIGYVGHTGLATSDHLHFEFRVDGVHKNPLTVTLPQADGISVKAKPQFLAHAKSLLHLLDSHEKIMIAENTP